MTYSIFLNESTHRIFSSGKFSRPPSTKNIGEQQEQTEAEEAGTDKTAGFSSGTFPDSFPSVTYSFIHTAQSEFPFPLKYFPIPYLFFNNQIKTLSQVSKPRAPPVLSKRKLLMPVIISSYASTNIQGKFLV